MKWESDELRAVALRLLLSKRVRATKRVEALLVELEELGIVAPTRCAGEYLLRPQKADALQQYVAMRWPGLAQAKVAFSSCPERISAPALRELRRAKLKLPADIRELNRKTWSAWAGAHSKSGHCTPPEGVVLTTDESLRLRPNAGLEILGEGGLLLHLQAMQTLLGEVAISERGFGQSWCLDGVMPEYIVTVENRGAFIDFPAHPSLLLLHSPGHNTALTTRLISRLPEGIPWLHYPDLDPVGIGIALSLSCGDRLRRPVTWIPRAAAALLETHALPLESPWPEWILPAYLRDDPVLSWLIQERRWLEQEAVVLLPQFAEELVQMTRLSDTAMSLSTLSSS